MAARETEAVQRAVLRYQAGENITAAATAEGVSHSSLSRALNRRGIPRRGPLAGTKHPAFIDGRTAHRKAQREGGAIPLINGCALV
jgi:hypothetical protein